MQLNNPWDWRKRYCSVTYLVVRRKRFLQHTIPGYRRRRMVPPRRTRGSCSGGHCTGCSLTEGQTRAHLGTRRHSPWPGTSEESKPSPRRPVSRWPSSGAGRLPSWTCLERSGRRTLPEAVGKRLMNVNGKKCVVCVCVRMWWA